MKILNLFTVTLMVVVVSSHAQAGGKAAYPGANGVPFRALQAQVDNLVESQSSTDELYNRILTLESEIADLQSRINSSMGDITDLQGRMELAESELALLQANLNVMQSSLENGCPSGMFFERMLSDSTVICSSIEPGSGGSVLSRSISVASVVQVDGATDAGVSATVTALCPKGYVTTGGGYEVMATSGFLVTRNAPYMNNGWAVTAINQSKLVAPMTAYVNCVSDM